MGGGCRWWLAGTVKVDGYGIDSVAKFFLDFGYTMMEELRFPAKKLKALWFAPPNYDNGSYFGGPLPRIFVSELLVDEMSPQSQAVIKKYVKNLGNANRYAALASTLGCLTWETPSYSDYQQLARESEYAAWTLVNGFTVNHVTISVHRLKSQIGNIKSLNHFIEDQGFKLNSEGGILKVSPDGLLLQSSTVADSTIFNFSDGVSEPVPCSYIEFAERLVLPQYTKLTNEEMELQNTPTTVQLGQGARIQLANAIIETGNAGATIQFGSLDFPAVIARTAAISAYGTDSEKTARRPHSAETSARSAHLSVPRVTITQDPRRRISVFERISQPEAPTTKRVVTGGRVSVGLTKKRFQRPLTADVRRTPPRERLSFAKVERRERRKNPLGEHRGVTPKLRIRGSTTERSRWKGKQSWRPKPRRDDERKEREIDLGVTSGVASRRSAPNSRDHQKWVEKKTHDDTCPDGRHLGEFSKGSRRSLTPPKEESNFDRSPQVEEVFFPNQQPEIQWRRRSEIRIPEEEEKEDMEGEEKYLKDEDYMEDEQEELNDIINMEVVYMVRHIEAEYDDGEDDGDWQPHPQQEYHHQHEAGSIAGGGDRSLRRQEMEVEENLFDDENATLADMRRHMRRQMRAKDKEISQLHEKMTEMMAQMTAMMQRTAAAGTIPNPPTDPPILRMPQVSGVRGARRGEADSTFFSRVDKEKQVVYNVDKGKQPMQYEEKPKQDSHPTTTFKWYQSIATCPSVTSSFVPPDDERKDDKKPVQEEKWETAISKKTTKMLKQLEGVPGVKWKSPTEPVLNLKGLPKVHASTSKQHLSQASSSKPRKPKFFKKKTKLKKPKEKKTVTQKVIDSLDEYYQTVRQSIKLADFMSELKIGETEEDGDADFLPTEVCRVISVAPSTSINEKYVKKEAPEACMMVLPMDCSSEEDLYFPEEDESDPDIASQMEHVNLGGDSESVDESPDTIMADSEENIKEFHRRDGFEVGNADKIFESTSMDQITRKVA
ncbi:hypothetical protein M5K25_024579 [Dendrobium thyrsiflorum]|uniref:2-oxoadipate dioxygenase/decarboxylase n=1 Tax=Dendrobium thyrsiflorum TaxID=117978 RepID=A0ABD0U294_DENTH